MSSNHYNPYEDDSLRCIKPEEPQESLENRKGFNDVMDYFDIVNGYQVPKNLESLPKKYKKVIRYGIIAYVIFVLYQLFDELISIITS